MKSSHPAESSHSAPTHYSPSVPMTVYRELAAELRANQAVIDSLNSRNQQLLSQNQMLKQEIHNVVQAALQLGQFAGVARQTAGEGTGQNFRQDFPNAIAPDTLAKLVRSESEAPRAPQSPNAAPATSHSRVPRPIAQNPAKHSMKVPAVKPAAKEAAREAARDAARISERANIARQQAPQRQPARQQSLKRTEAPIKSAMAKAPLPKLFTEKGGSYRSTSLESSENKEIGGIWLALSIILIIVTAFGAGFLIMKPLLNDR